MEKIRVHATDGYAMCYTYVLSWLLEYEGFADFDFRPKLIYYYFLNTNLQVNFYLIIFNQETIMKFKKLESILLVINYFNMIFNIHI